MAQDAVKHDYHLVNPSPWPLVGSIAAVCFAIGLVTDIKGLFGLPKGTWWLLAVGLLGILYTMIGWWSRRGQGGQRRATTLRWSRSACATA